MQISKPFTNKIRKLASASVLPTLRKTGQETLAEEPPANGSTPLGTRCLGYGNGLGLGNGLNLQRQLLQQQIQQQQLAQQQQLLETIRQLTAELARRPVATA